MRAPRRRDWNRTHATSSRVFFILPMVSWTTVRANRLWHRFARFRSESGREGADSTARLKKIFHRPFFTNLVEIHHIRGIHRGKKFASAAEFARRRMRARSPRLTELF